MSFHEEITALDLARLREEIARLEAHLQHAREAINAGCFGFIFGRNMWKREKSNALEITRKLQALLDEA